jgi:hypothetical protein
MNLFARKPAVPGGQVDLVSWPRTLAPNVPRDVVQVRLTR